MAKLYYRGMAEQNGKPKIGRSARLLGVRPTIDINIEQMPMGCLYEQGYLLPEPQRKWQIDDSIITGDLQAVQDSPTHVSIMPRVTMALEKYEIALANTQQYWQRVD
jgi:hypothetical protein